MSADELRQECRKSIRMKVSDMNGLARVMEKKGYEYKVIDDSTADVYAEINFSEMAKAFEEENCSIITMEEHEESLEAFYLELLGDKENA